MSIRPNPSPLVVEQWLSTLDVALVRLTECRISRGWALNFAGYDQAGIHCVLRGNGFLKVQGSRPVALAPNRVILIPPRRSYRFEATRTDRTPPLSRTVSLPACLPEPATFLRRCSAGADDPELVLICGHFQMQDGAVEISLGRLRNALAIALPKQEQVGEQLTSALGELTLRRPGASAMATTILQQVLITFFREAVRSDEWLAQLGFTADPRIARAFAHMASHCDLEHSVSSLAEIAGMSRTSFAVGFRVAFGTTPMAALRDIRLRRAAELMSARQTYIDSVCHQVGYSSRSSFTRAFRKVFGQDPTAFARRRQSSSGEEANQTPVA